MFEACTSPAACSSTAYRSSAFPRLSCEREVEPGLLLGVEDQGERMIIGRTFTIDELFSSSEYDAVFIAVGAGLPVFPTSRART
jgi:hypothetical protein